MLLIETYLKEVSGKGLGLFTSGFVKKGTIIYKDDYVFAKVFTSKEVEKFTEAYKKFIIHYGCYMKENDSWHVDLDNTRFLNHSNTPNVRYDIGDYHQGGGGTMVNIEDIEKDSELTVNYVEMNDYYKEGNFDFEIK